MKKEVTKERLCELMEYDMQTGKFTWKKGRLIGLEAGHISKQYGYRLIGIDGSLYLAHRLAWLFVTGSFPIKVIDHKNRVKSDNSWNNLREATMSQNTANSASRKTSFSGVKGVSWCNTAKKWRATIVYHGKQVSLGRFANIDDAANAYKIGAKKLFGDFAFVG